MEQLPYRFVPSLVQRQARAEKAMLEEFCAGDYPFSAPLIKVNPYFIAPLTAVLLFRTERATAVTVAVRGKELGGGVSHTFPPAGNTFSQCWACTPDRKTP